LLGSAPRFCETVFEEYVVGGFENGSVWILPLTSLRPSQEQEPDRKYVPGLIITATVNPRTLHELLEIRLSRRKIELLG
jgi:hypothetical protein